MPKVSVKLQNVTVVFNKGTPNEITALKNINLEVAPGEVLVLLGGNGSGKSTLLKIIAGIIKPTEGCVLIDGEDVTKQKDYQRAKGISFVHQDPLLGTCPNLTLFENLALSGNKKWWLPFPYGLSLNKDKTHVLESTGLGLEERMPMPLSNFSGGQRQAIAIGIEFSNQECLLLLDEFTSSLDETTSENVFAFSMEHAKKNRATLIMIVHDLDQAMKIHCSILLMVNGAIVSKIWKSDLASTSKEKVKSLLNLQQNS